jgi:hypothetical protein
MSDFNLWFGKQNTDGIANLGNVAWRDALKLTRAAWDHQDAINDTLRVENERLNGDIKRLNALVLELQDAINDTLQEANEREDAEIDRLNTLTLNFKTL